jgi:hypothetical protein
MKATALHLRLFRLWPPSFALWMAAAALLIYAVAMLRPYIAATLVRGSTVTAWTHLATAPIQGRAPAVMPTIGSTVGADGVIMEVVNDRLDPAPCASPKRRSPTLERASWPPPIITNRYRSSTGSGASS